ncbi:MAG TPA: hypothetical protein VHD61_02195 [Lacunisphaera sp.]|nr:hypothetical protein [Lacunisphaera sp.]
MKDSYPIPMIRTRPASGAGRSTAVSLVVNALLLAAFAVGCEAQPPATEPYPQMAPLEQYLMPRDAEIALARSAGPASVTREATVLVLGRHGFETAVPGHNGFVCLVQRLWSAPLDDPEFWNPKGRGPTCFNAAAARYFVPLLNKKAELVFAGKSKAEIASAVKAALDTGEIPALGAGTMCFMMAKEGYLNDGAGHWHPHLMFFVHGESAASWGADLPGSPIFSTTDPLDQVTTFMVPVRRWSDGSIDAH